MRPFLVSLAGGVLASAALLVAYHHLVLPGVLPPAPAARPPAAVEITDEQFDALVQRHQERRDLTADRNRAVAVLERAGVVLDEPARGDVLDAIARYLRTVRDATRAPARAGETQEARRARMREAREDLETELSGLLPEAQAQTIVQSFPQLEVVMPRPGPRPGG